MLVAFVGALVLGILGMHALTLHKDASGGHVATVAVQAHGPTQHTYAGSGHRPGWRAASTVGGDPRAHTTLTARPAPDGGDGGAGLAVLCMAMVALTGAFLTLLHRAGIPWARARSVATASVRRTAPRQGTGPPPVWAFSVIRC